MKIKSAFSRNYFLFVLLLPIVLILIINAFSGEPIEKSLIPILILSGFLLFLFSILYATTYYKIENEQVIISMFFYKTKINISEIRRIKHSNSLIKTNLYKPSFHYKGIEIEYNKYDDIFISPKNNELFINQLLQRNPKIEIKQ